MESKNKTARRMQTIRGLLLRIIVACLLFIFLFLGKTFSLEIFQYNTNRVIEQVQNKSIVETIQDKLDDWLE